MLPNYVSVIVKYIPPSAVKGSRVKLTFSLAEKSKTIDYSHEFNSAEEVATAFLASYGIKPIGRTSLSNGSDAALIFDWDNFAPIQHIFCKR